MERAVNRYGNQNRVVTRTIHQPEQRYKESSGSALYQSG